MGGQYVIPASELEWSFTTSGGPGGQHANRSQTRVELRFDLAGSGVFPQATKERMMATLGRRLTDGRITVTADEHRSQLRNRQDARRRLAELLGNSMVVTKRQRPTGPTLASRRKRAEAKRARAEVKRLRGKPREDG